METALLDALAAPAESMTTITSIFLCFAFCIPSKNFKLLSLLYEQTCTAIFFMCFHPQLDEKLVLNIILLNLNSKFLCPLDKLNSDGINDRYTR